MRPLLELIAEIEREPARARPLLTQFTHRESFPMVEGDTATFFYWDGRPTDKVFLKHWVFGLSSTIEFQRIPHTDAFYLFLDLPKGARVEYKLEVVRDGRGTWMQDPRNPRRAYDPFGSNSVCPAGSYVDPEWVAFDPAARQGRLETGTVHSTVFGEARTYKMYIPAEARAGKRYPLLVVHDGDDFLHFATMKTVLDNLIHRHEVAPIHVCFTSGVLRNAEYAANPTHADYVRNELVPALEERYSLLSGPANRGLMGASFGAVASLYTKVRHPGVFGRLMLLSGSFAFTDIGDHQRGPAWDPVVSFVNGFRGSARHLHAQVFMSCGTFESLIYYNRSLVPLLAKRCDGLRFTEAPDGHNWINWRDRLREGLTYLFPGPLWMYYE
jgi:enterochelin esterase family protein